jgi:hypothetical protein
VEGDQSAESLRAREVVGEESEVEHRTAPGDGTSGNETRELSRQNFWRLTGIRLGVAFQLRLKDTCGAGADSLDARRELSGEGTKDRRTGVPQLCGDLRRETDDETDVDNTDVGEMDAGSLPSCFLLLGLRGSFSGLIRL